MNYGGHCGFARVAVETKKIFSTKRYFWIYENENAQNKNRKTFPFLKTPSGIFAFYCRSENLISYALIKTTNLQTDKMTILFWFNSRKLHIITPMRHVPKNKTK